MYALGSELHSHWIKNRFRAAYASREGQTPINRRDKDIDTVSGVPQWEERRDGWGDHGIKKIFVPF